MLDKEWIHTLDLHELNLISAQPLPPSPLHCPWKVLYLPALPAVLLALPQSSLSAQVLSLTGNWDRAGKTSSFFLANKKGEAELFYLDDLSWCLQSDGLQLLPTHIEYIENILLSHLTSVLEART